MKFGDERCNWRAIVQNEVLNAFAPRSAWIWKSSQTSKLSSPKDNTRTLSHDEPKLSKLLGRLKMAKKILLNSQNERNKSSTTKTDEAIDKKTRRRLIICNGSKVTFIETNR